MESNKSYTHSHILFTQPYSDLPILHHKSYKTAKHKNPFHIKLGAYTNENYMRNTKAYMQNHSFMTSNAMSYRNFSHLTSTQFSELKSLGKYEKEVENERQKYYFPKRSILSPIILFTNAHKKKGLHSGVELDSNLTERTKAFPLRPIKENLVRNIKLVMRKLEH